MKQDFDIKEVVRSRIVQAVVNKKPSNMTRPYNVFIYMHGCEKTYKFNDGTKIHAKSGDFIFVPPGTSYQVRCTVPGETYSINFELYDQPQLSPFLFRPKNQNVFFDSLKAAEKAWRRKYTGFQMRLKAETYTFICNMIKEYELEYVSKSTLSRINPAIRYIQDEYTKENISISTLAELCGMSEVSFRKIFTNAMGITPLKYINNLKLENAKELLSTKTYKISKAAELSGFKCDSYFSREFKKHTGMSPIEYKNSIE